MGKIGSLSWRVAGAWGTPSGHQQAVRLVWRGVTVTEIGYDLGEGDRLGADGLSSLYPKEATLLPRVGYYRAVPLEGVLSMRPDLVLASENAGPPSVLDRIRALGVTVRTISDEPSLSSLYKRVEQVAAQLGVRSEELRGGKEWVRRGRSRGAPYH